MLKISKSPDRHTFQKEGYIKRQEEAGEPINEAYLEMFEKIIDEHSHKFEDPESSVNNLEYDLLTTDWILEKVRTNDNYAQNLYAAMCNNGFIRLAVIPVLKGEEWGCSWRSAGGIIADMQEKMRQSLFKIKFGPLIRIPVQRLRVECYVFCFGWSDFFFNLDAEPADRLSISLIVFGIIVFILYANTIINLGLFLIVRYSFTRRESCSVVLFYNVRKSARKRD